jgi:Secretion system C-terminal sorting domain
MKKVLIYVGLLSSGLALAQAPGTVSPIEQEAKASPNGYFDKVMDRLGKVYNLKDLKTPAKQPNLYYAKAAIARPEVVGIFELYYDTGSGMENANDPKHLARRSVLRQVFQDVSSFINTPLKQAGNNNKVRFWIQSSVGMPTNALGGATSFYTMPYNVASNFGGIVDGEVYKTIQGGLDSFTNTGSALSNTSGNPGASSGDYYHGMAQFNFNFNWNTDLKRTANANEIDLYTVALHEVVHALGFASLIGKDGNSNHGTGYQYYSRYDQLLTSAAAAKLISPQPSNSSLYNYAFAGTTAMLNPGCKNPYATNQTVCNTAIQFSGASASKVPVYTPACHEGGSSLSHFEDQCIAAPNQGNDTYFAMSNAVGKGVTKRFLKPQERNALQDIGYSLNTSFGNNTNAAGSATTYTAASTTALDVQGINDGISNTGLFTFVGNANSPINITSLLTNDYNAVSFEGLEDVNDKTATLSATSGNNTTAISFSSAVSGVHLLRYVPINAAGKRGNITYVYVYVSKAACGSISACDLVINGGFEENNGRTDRGYGDMIACNWASANSASPDYFHTTLTNNSYARLQIPCNAFGVQDTRRGNAHAGIAIRSGFQENLVSELARPLSPNTEYMLSFDVARSESYGSNAVRLQACLSNSPQAKFTVDTGDIPIDSNDILLETNHFPVNTNDWETITFKFKTGATSGENFLYIGGLNKVKITAMPQVALLPPCTSLYDDRTSGWSYYYLDNVSLIPVSALNGAKFDLPPTLCSTSSLADLGQFLSAVPANGTFTGPGVNARTFTASTAGAGTHSIVYSYTNTSGCLVSIASNITVDNNASITPTFTPPSPVCAGTAPVLPTTSLEGISGTWARASVTPLVYSFTASAGQCQNIQPVNLTVEVLDASNANCASQNTCQDEIILETPEQNQAITYKTKTLTEARKNYVVDNGKEVKLRSEKTISLKPGTYLSKGSNVWAKIEPCASTSKKASKKSQAAKLAGDTLADTVLSLYPNPADNKINIQSNANQSLGVKIRNLEGKLLYENSSQQATMEVEVSQWPQGLYLVDVVVDSEETKPLKFIKK